ncbi:MAG: iron ABC transporter permease [Armatimonadetes bacterium]|nr:iron ABC transporter permease [Candidatus Hippobium faecium]
MIKKILLFFVLSAVLISVCSLFGAMDFTLKDIIKNQYIRDLWLEMRLPRCILGFMAGSALAVSGMGFQAVFRNPLAEPFTLGISGGATLGCVVCVTLGLSSFMGVSLLPVFAFGGGAVSVFAVYCLAGMKKSSSPSIMLLAGIGVNFFFSALILLLEYFSSEYSLAKIMHWTMGGVDITGFGKIWEILPFYAVGMFAVCFCGRELNLLSLGEDIAIGRGVNTEKVKKIIFLGASFMVGAVCAVCGPIAFVGMICPHIMRMIFGYDNRVLFWVCGVFGGVFLTLCDTVSRCIIPPSELPVGIITSLLGGPFFIYLLFRKKSL